MNKLERAISLFNEGFNCCQSVIAVFHEDLKFDKELVLKISSGFGGGMGQGEVCGAVTGAIMAIGLKYGSSEVNDDKKQEVKDIINKFSEEFKKRNSSIICRELLECNEGEINGKKCICVKAVRDAVEILENDFHF
ncbi:C-GCAxxG-C-C family protein [Clostridium malenominatum]|uniref:C-GCAxxG-C-C family protein n=1 Tax=Clostridium malenominatum TaxID=1539 RepID=A0ABP3TRJ0_9CLOT